MQLIFIRHGEPDYSIDSLTPKGWREAELLGPRVAKWDVKEFYVSPLGRAQDTASPAMKLTGRTPVIKEWLHEFDPPMKPGYEGRRGIVWDIMPEIWTNQPEMLTLEHWFDAPVYEAREVRQEYLRVTGEMDKLLAEHGYVRDGQLYRVTRSNDDTLVFFCHLGITCVMLGHLLSIPASVALHSFFLPTTSVTALATEERQGNAAKFRLQCAGDTRHLREAGEPVSQAGGYAQLFQD